MQDTTTVRSSVEDACDSDLLWSVAMTEMRRYCASVVVVDVSTAVESCGIPSMACLREVRGGPSRLGSQCRVWRETNAKGCCKRNRRSEYCSIVRRDLCSSGCVAGGRGSERGSEVSAAAVVAVVVVVVERKSIHAANDQSAQWTQLRVQQESQSGSSHDLSGRGRGCIT